MSAVFSPVHSINFSQMALKGSSYSHFVVFGKVGEVTRECLHC